jgi:hypothetical protein
MKPRCSIVLIALSFLLCLGSSGLASAASVTGAGVVSVSGTPVVWSVSARSGSGRAQGVMHAGAGGQVLFIANVIDLCVLGNQAAVIGLITHSSTQDVPPGQYLYVGIEDNGRTGDGIGFAGASPDLLPCASLLPFSSATPITSGNFTVTP